MKVQAACTLEYQFSLIAVEKKFIANKLGIGI